MRVKHRALARGVAVVELAAAAVPVAAVAAAAETPARGDVTSPAGDVQPFTEPLDTTTPQSLSAGGTSANQAPFVPLMPSVLLGTR